MQSQDAFSRALMLLVPVIGCETLLAFGIQQLAKHLTPSHSLTSRRYAVWPLVHRYVDAPFERCLRHWHGHWDERLLQGALLSRWSRGPPPWRIEGNAASAMSTGPPLTKNPRRKTRSTTEVQEIDWQIANLEEWRQHLESAIALAGAMDATERHVCCASLISIQNLLTALQYFRPLRGGHPRFDGLLPDRLTRPQPVTYCALCWRLSLRSEKLGEGKSPIPPDAGVRRLSNRYCAVHNPSDPDSRYWTDRRYREGFERQLVLLRVDQGLGEVELRQLAYKRAHEPRPVIRHSSGLREKVQAMLVEGLSQAEIARRLGVSRQTVWKIVNR